MKIGILTFHCAHNYGAVLQAFALQEYIISLGHRVRIIDYRPEYLKSPYRVFALRRFFSRKPVKALKRLVTEPWCFLLIRIGRFRKFEKFIRTRLLLAGPVKGNAIPGGYDVYIYGSDQIWNANITHGFDRIYFGVVPVSEGRKVSYGASLGNKKLSEKDKAFLRDNLGNFDALSVREASSASVVRPLTDKKVEIVLDPTFLLSEKAWDKIAVKPGIREPYVIVYQVRESRETIVTAENVAQQLHAKVIVLTAWPSLGGARIKDQKAGPGEFVGWIGNAACVITTSFHGTVFSILLKRPFYTVALNDGKDGRSEDLLKELGLAGRIVAAGESPVFSIPDFSLAEKRLDALREKSRNYLRQAIDGAK